MTEVNLNAIDLNLLPPLQALLRLRNVTKAAAATGMSQPAMSRALARLRATLDDALLIRAAGGLALTPKGQGLLPRVDKALLDISTVFQEPVFDPRSEQRRIRICCTDFHAILLAPALMARLAVEAPGVDVTMEPYGPDLMTRMQSGAVDLTFALSSTALPPGARSLPLSRDELVVVMRRKHPASRRGWSLGDYGRFDHVGISIMGDGASEIDAELAAHGIKRRMALVTPSFTAALAATAKSNLVTTVSRRFARHFASSFDLVMKRPPLQSLALQPVLVWSDVRSGDRLLMWLCAVIQELS